MSENWKIQVSPKLTDGTLINLRAENPVEAEQILNWAIANAAKIGEAVAAVNAVSVVAGAFPGSQVVNVQAAPQVAPQQQYQQPAPQQGGGSAPNEPAPTCAHGEREWKDFVSKAGKPIKGWFCTVKNSDCKPLWRN